MLLCTRCASFFHRLFCFPGSAATAAADRAFVDETLAEAMPKSANQLSRNLQNMIFGEGSTRKVSE